MGVALSSLFFDREEARPRGFLPPFFHFIFVEDFLSSPFLFFTSSLFSLLLA